MPRVTRHRLLPDCRVVGTHYCHSRYADGPVHRFRPCARCGGSPAIHNTHPENAAYPGHEYA